MVFTSSIVKEVGEQDESGETIGWNFSAGISPALYRFSLFARDEGGTIWDCSSSGVFSFTFSVVFISLSILSNEIVSVCVNVCFSLLTLITVFCCFWFSFGVWHQDNTSVVDVDMETVGVMGVDGVWSIEISSKSIVFWTGMDVDCGGGGDLGADMSVSKTLINGESWRYSRISVSWIGESSFIGDLWVDLVDECGELWSESYVSASDWGKIAANSFICAADAVWDASELYADPEESSIMLSAACIWFVMLFDFLCFVECERCFVCFLLVCFLLFLFLEIENIISNLSISVCI